MLLINENVKELRRPDEELPGDEPCLLDGPFDSLEEIKEQNRQQVVQDAGTITDNMTDEEKKLFWELVYLAARDKKAVRSLQPIEQYLNNIMMKMIEPKPKSAEDQIALAPPIGVHNI